MATSSVSSSGDPSSTTTNHDFPSDLLLHPRSFIDAEQNGPDSVPNYVTVDVTSERPSWLPEGWTMSVKVCGSGATAGTIDQYYFAPSSELRLRSRKEVEYYLKIETTRKKSDASADVQHSESPSSEKMKSKSCSKKSFPTSLFDFEKTLEMTTWKVKYASKWVPFIDDKMVSKSTREQWEDVFQSHLSGTSGT